MQSQPATTISPEELKRRLEAIVGHEIDATPEQLNILRFPVGSYAAFSSDEDARVTWRGLIFPGKFCVPDRLLDVCGASTTEANGRRVFLLSDFVCLSSEELAEPVNIVATPRSGSPVFVTMDYTPISSGTPPIITDLQITVFAWQANGSPAPNVGFHWRCRVTVHLIVS